ncbi:MAG: hypothetical protein HKN30_15975 [Sulfitobacter sp.]|nr:hypothetical protein [Sulfitobacter sp.]
MITWISRSLLAALALTALSGCEEAPGANTEDGSVFALQQLQMASGAVTLVPPEGYCIDRRSVRRRFALMARCDVLGLEGAGRGAPLGVIIVSLTPLAADAPLPTPQQNAAALGLSSVSGPVTRETSVVFRAEGAAPAQDLSQEHWRGVARVKEFGLGLAFYRQNDAGRISREGRDLLSELIRRTQASSG